MTEKKSKCLARYKSKTSPGEWHEVQIDANGYVTCTCKGFGYAKKCWHRERVLERLSTRGYKL